MIKPLQKATWHYLPNLNICLPSDPEIPLIYTYNRNVYTHISKDMRIFRATSFIRAEAESHPDTSAIYSRMGGGLYIPTNGTKMKDKNKFQITNAA